MAIPMLMKIAPTAVLSVFSVTRLATLLNKAPDTIAARPMMMPSGQGICPWSVYPTTPEAAVIAMRAVAVPMAVWMGKSIT